jgi:hypothetical protein
VASASRERLLEFLDTRIVIPRVPDAAALDTILTKRVMLNVPDTEQPGARFADVASKGALEALFEAYTEGASIRRVLQLSHIALNEAIDSEAEGITADHVVAALRSG